MSCLSRLLKQAQVTGEDYGQHSLPKNYAKVQLDPRMLTFGRIPQPHGVAHNRFYDLFKKRFNFDPQRNRKKLFKLFSRPSLNPVVSSNMKYMSNAFQKDMKRLENTTRNMYAKYMGFK